VGRMKMQVRKNQVPGGGIMKYGKIKYDCAEMENASTEKASTNVQRRKVQARKNEVRLSWGGKCKCGLFVSFDTNTNASRAVTAFECEISSGGKSGKQVKHLIHLRACSSPLKAPGNPIFFAFRTTA